MLSKISRIVAVTVITLLALTIFGSFSFAADAKAAPGAFGCVDMEAVFNSSQKKKDNEVKFQAFVGQKQQQVDLRQKNRLLTPEEYTQLATLSTQATTTDAEKAKIAEIQNLSKTRDQELQTLQQKKDATEPEKARLAALQTQLIQSDQALKDDAAKFSDDIEKMRDSLSQEVKADINKTVEAVAKDKGLAVVFNKTSGDVVLVVYASVDITNDVIQKMPKK
ncbi:MAG: OmpH/Skp family outer membrane protein [Armatimonadota bacterium]